MSRKIPDDKIANAREGLNQFILELHAEGDTFTETKTEDLELLKRIDAMTNAQEFAEIARDISWDLPSACMALSAIFDVPYNEDEMSMYGGEQELELFATLNITVNPGSYDT